MATSANKNTRSATTILYFIAFVDFFGVSLIVPLLTGHVKSLGASPSVAGLIASIYGGIQLISAPLVGRWSDRSGRRHVLIICTVISGLSYALGGVGSSLIIMTLARIPLGIFKHTQEISKAYLADVTPESMHAAVYGQINAAGSMGFILGPIVGGHLAESSLGFNGCCFLAAALFLLNGFISWSLLPEVPSQPHPDLVRSESTSSVKTMASDEISFHPKRFLASFKKIHWDHIWDIFLFRFLLGFAVMVFRSNFNLSLEYKYNITPKTIGYTISYGAIVSTMSSYAVGKIANFYSDDLRLLRHNTFATLVTMIAFTYAPTYFVMCMLLAPFSLCNAIGRVNITKLTIKKGGSQESGTLFGLGQSVMSIARFLSPLIGGIALEFSSNGPGIVGSCIAGAGLALVLIHPMDSFPSPDKKHD